MIAGEGFHPAPIVIGAPAEHFLGHSRNPDDLMDEVDDLFGPGQPRGTHG